MTDGEPERIREAPPGNQSSLPSMGERLLAVSAYWAIGLFLCRWFRSSSLFIQRHIRQAESLFFYLFMIVFIFCMTVAGLSLLMIYHRALYDSIAFEAWTLSIFRKILIVWICLWCFGFVYAFLGSLSVLPVLSWPAQFRPVTWTVRLLVAISILTLLGAAGMARYAQTRALAAPDHATAVFFYEDVDGRYPRWLFAVGYAPSLSAAARHWGKDKISLCKLTDENLYKSLKTAEFIFVGSHGTKDGILLKTGYVTPADIETHGAGKQLRYVYLAGCDSGAQRTAWESAFTPATVITHDRLTPMLEHLGWLWFRGPALLNP